MIQSAKTEDSLETQSEKQKAVGAGKEKATGVPSKKLSPTKTKPQGTKLLAEAQATKTEIELVKVLTAPSQSLPKREKKGQPTEVKVAQVIPEAKTAAPKDTSKTKVTPETPKPVTTKPSEADKTKSHKEAKEPTKVAELAKPTELVNPAEIPNKVEQVVVEEQDDHHLRRIQAVEPLVQLNKPRVLEEVIPYVIKPPPDLVPGSAIEKVYSFEKTGVSDIVLTDFKVGVEVNVEVDDEMSRKYTSTSSSRTGECILIW